ncbi:MAG: radical SAM protein [Eubacteriales bacterium]|nr:radical SAM protein [Eubacteriales bacterium]
MTQSVCPVCLRVLDAERRVENGGTYLCKTCPEHGAFKTLVWAGDYAAWGSARAAVAPVNPAHAAAKGCPYDCGLCTAHEQRSCCVLLEVTQRCDLGCPVCFAKAGGGTDMPINEIEACFDGMLAMGGPFNIQLSGGEPTMRDDLEAIIRLGKGKGFSFFQLNTNGIRIARDASYIQRLADAGLNCVFLQFDGMNERAYEILRGKPLLQEKLNAVENCAKAGVGVVLVPTVAAGVNDDQVGAILEFACAHMPAIRGVHFQPMSRFGRCEVDAGRYTLPQLLADIEKQTGGRMKAADFTPGNAEDPHCSFSANFMQNEDGSLQRCGDGGCCCGAPTDASARARKFVAKRWSGARRTPRDPEKKQDVFDAFLDKLENQTLAVSAMAFMDAWTLDIERLKHCYINVVRYKGGKVELIPFCAYNLSAADGTTLYRGR